MGNTVCPYEWDDVNEPLLSTVVHGMVPMALGENPTVLEASTGTSWRRRFVLYRRMMHFLARA
jgi:hypothetical protein